MGAIFDPFKARKNRAMEFVVQVPFPSPVKGKPGDDDYTPEVKPAFELTVKRLPPRLLDNAFLNGEARARQRGLSEGQPGFFKQRNIAYYACLADEMAKEHVYDWRNLDGSELPKFSKPAFAAWLEGDGYDWRMLIGFAYLETQKVEDEKKTADPATTGEASSKPSETDSSTSSPAPS